MPSRRCARGGNANAGKLGMTMTNEHDTLVDTNTLAGWLRVHGYTISRLFPWACVARNEKGAKIYSAALAASVISEQSGYPIACNQLHTLITQVEALRLLESLGHSRSRATFRFWTKTGAGPKPYRLGSLMRYKVQDVTEFAEHLKGPGRKLPRRSDAGVAA